jgi:hypothetical protein
LEAEFGIPFMADNIGGFKLGTVSGRATVSSGGGAPTAVAGTPTAEILTSKRLLKVPYINCGVPGAKSLVVANIPQ